MFDDNMNLNLFYLIVNELMSVYVENNCFCIINYELICIMFYV